MNISVQYMLIALVCGGIFGSPWAFAQLWQFISPGLYRREKMMAIQTPQMFEAGVFRKAYAQKNLDSTDDAQLVERLGERVVVVQGESSNIKITRAADLAIARAVLGVRPPVERDVLKRF